MYLCHFGTFTAVCSCLCHLNQGVPFRHMDLRNKIVTCISQSEINNLYPSFAEWTRLGIWGRTFSIKDNTSLCSFRVYLCFALKAGTPWFTNSSLESNFYFFSFVVFLRKSFSVYLLTVHNVHNENPISIGSKKNHKVYNTCVRHHPEKESHTIPRL